MNSIEVNEFLLLKRASSTGKNRILLNGPANPWIPSTCSNVKAFINFIDIVVPCEMNIEEV